MDKKKGYGYTLENKYTEESRLNDFLNFSRKTLLTII